MNRSSTRITNLKTQCREQTLKSRWTSTSGSELRWARKMLKFGFQGLTWQDHPRSSPPRFNVHFCDITSPRPRLWQLFYIALSPVTVWLAPICSDCLCDTVTAWCVHLSTFSLPLICLRLVRVSCSESEFNRIVLWISFKINQNSASRLQCVVVTFKLAILSRQDGFYLSSMFSKGASKRVFIFDRENLT